MLASAVAAMVAINQKHRNRTAVSFHTLELVVLADSQHRRILLAVLAVAVVVN